MNSALKDGACKCPSVDLRGPTFGSMTAAQHRNVPCRCGIGRANMPAANALEPISRGTVLPIDTAAFRARLRRVSRIDRHQRNAGKCSLVGQLRPELSKRPTVVRAALGLSNRCPRPDVRQIFDGNPAPGVFGPPYDFLADPMVEVGGEPRLFGPAMPQQSLGRLGPFLLEAAAQPRMPPPEVGIVGAAMDVAVTVSGDIPAAQVHAKILGRIARGHFAYVDGHVEEEHAAAIDQIGLSTHSVELFVLVCASDPRHDQPAVQRPDRDAIRALPRQDTLVVDDGAVGPESRLDGLVALVDLADLGDGADRHLRRQAEVAPGIIINQPLQLDLVRALVSERHDGDCVTRRIEPHHGRQQRRSLFGGRQESDLHSQVHAS
jgi:prepilin-type processing-associated H-X9-DG protein